MSGVAALDVHGLAKAFGGVKAIDNVTFTVPDGTLTAVIGPNGAGKTTVFNLVTSLFRADAGEITFYGDSIVGLPSEKIASLGLIRTFQTARVFPGMTVIENALAGAHLKVRSGMIRQMLWLGSARREERALRAEAEALLDLVGLSEFRNAAGTDLPMGGQKLLEVVRALMARPRLLLLDEPAAGLNDKETEDLAELLSAVRGAGITVVVVEHNMSLVMSISDQIVVMDAGKIAACGAPAEIQKDPRVIAAYVGQGTVTL